MKMLHATSLVMTMFGIVLMVYAASTNTEDDWTPVTRPYPGTGFQIKDAITIAKGTKYWLEVEMPDHPLDVVGGGERPPFECVLHIKITADSVTYVDDTVKQFTHEGEERFAQIESYISDKGWDLKRGEYDLEISSEKTPEIISTHGALLKFGQIANPVGSILRAEFNWLGAYLLCGLGLLGLVFDAFRRTRKGAAPAPC